MYNAILVTPPSSELITVAEARHYTRIDMDSDLEDSILEGWIKAGREKAERYLKRAFLDQTWNLVFDEFPVGKVRLPMKQFKELKSASYVLKEDGSTVELDVEDFSVNKATNEIIYEENYPVVTLQSLGGFTLSIEFGPSGAVPARIKDAIYLYIAYRSENRLGETDVVPRAFYQIIDGERYF